MDTPVPDPRPASQRARDRDAKSPLYYFENRLLVYTAAFHLQRGYCCGSGCRHCPYEPKHVEGNKKVSP